LSIVCTESVEFFISQGRTAYHSNISWFTRTRDVRGIPEKRKKNLSLSGLSKWARILARHLNEYRTSYCLSQFVDQMIFTYLTIEIFLKLGLYIFGDRGRTVVKVLCYKSEGRWFDPSWCQWIMDIKSFRSHHGPGVDSASNRNEYQEYLLRAKSGRCVRLTTLPQSCAVVTKSGNLNFLEPSGHVQACDGTAFF